MKDVEGGEREKEKVSPGEPSREGRGWIIPTWLGVLFALLGVGGGGAAFLGWQFHIWLQPVQQVAQPKLVDIPPGASLGRIAQILSRQGLIRQERVFIWLAQRQGRARSLHPGRYLLSPHQSPQAILDQLVAADVATAKITFPEGFTLEQMAQRVKAQGLGQGARYRELATREAASFEVPGLPKGQSLEGYLFPDTYQIPLGADEEVLIRLQLDRFEQVVASLEREYKTDLSRHEVVTLASLIEREAKVDGDRRRISGVLHNRLQRGLRLEVDATVLYALGEHKARVLYRDLQVDSPYNTYQHSGLPPGPIANPGRASLEAALDPAPTECLYYVARPDGTHVFSRTLAEHNRAKRQVRRSAR